MRIEPCVHVATRPGPLEGMGILVVVLLRAGEQMIDQRLLTGPLAAGEIAGGEGMQEQLRLVKIRRHAPA